MLGGGMRPERWLAPWLLAAAATGAGAAELTDVDRAFHRLYSYDFAGAHAVLDEALAVRPRDPLLHAVRGAAYLFSEFDRLQILELEFFADDDKVTDGRRLEPDPAARERLFRATAETRRLALERLTVDANDRDAIFALCTAIGTESDYYGLVEKRYLRTYALSKENQRYARRLLALDPPFYDAYLTLGSVEYVVSNLNFFFRLFVRFEDIEGSQQKAVENLRQVVRHGRYYRPFAKILLAAIHLREDEPRQALVLLRELQREFPENSLVRNEIRRTEAKTR
jgi:hypothetical protein